MQQWWTHGQGPLAGSGAIMPTVLLCCSIPAAVAGTLQCTQAADGPNNSSMSPRMPQEHQGALRCCSSIYNPTAIPQCALTCCCACCQPTASAALPVHLQQHAHHILCALLAAQQGVNSTCSMKKRSCVNNSELCVWLHCTGYSVSPASPSLHTPTMAAGHLLWLWRRLHCR